VSEWKVPDWRDPAQYPHPRDCSLRQWAWEFLRRNPEYRALWREHIEPFYDPTLRYQDQDVGVVGPAYGVPADKQAAFMLLPADKQAELGYRHRFGLDSFPPSPDDDYPPLFTGTGLRYTAEREARMLLYPGQIAVVFDLTRSIRRQLAAAKMVFDEERKQGGIPEPHRNRIEWFASYLRVLDGVDAGAKPTKIGAMLFPKQSKKQRLSYVRDYRDAAIKLRDKDYFVHCGR
jgi:hypothetical protein